MSTGGRAVPSMTPTIERALTYADYTLHANVEDVNLDGYPDLLLGSYYSNDGAYLGSANGYSANNFDDFNQAYIYDVAGGDLNGDGLYDMVTCQYLNDAGNSYDTSSAIYWNGFTGFSNTFITALQTYGCRDVEIVDANQDGFEDIVFVSHVSGPSGIIPTIPLRISITVQPLDTVSTIVTPFRVTVV